MTVTKEKVKKLLLNKSNYRNKTMEKFLEDPKYNPWKTDEANKVIKDFANRINELSEALSGDSEASSGDFSWLNIEEKFKEKKTGIPTNIRYALPTHIQGNVEKANFFVCLTNPNIDREDRVEKTKTFVEYFNNFPLENNKDTTFNFKGFISKYNSDDKNYEYIYNKIITDEHPLKREWDSFLKNDDFTLKKYEEAVEKDKESGKESKDIGKDFIDEFKKNYYYLWTYYCKFLQSKLITMKTDFDINEISNLKEIEIPLVFKDKYSDKVDDIIENSLVCNLESFPFRSKNPDYSKNGQGLGNLILDNETNTALFSPRIILHKIARYLEDEDKVKPVFVFRRFDTIWEKNIKKVLTKDYEITDKDDKDDVIEYLYLEHFYFIVRKDFNNTNDGAITENNVTMIDKNGPEKKEIKIGKNGLEELANIAFPNK